MEFKKLKIDTLIPASYNPRKALKPGDPEFEKIKNAITEFGYVDPIIVNSDKGAKLLAATDANLYPAPIEDICYKNPAYHRPTAEPTGRKHFFANNGQSFHNKIEKLCKVSIKTKIKRLIKDIAFTIFSAKALGNIKRKITK